MKKVFIIPKVKDLDTTHRIEALQMIRDDICGEYDAIKGYENHIALYTQLYNDTHDETWQKLIEVTQDIINEERAHIGELNKLLSIIDRNECENFNKGVDEVKEKLNDTSINDLAMSKSDAADICMGLGKKFMQHFAKICNQPQSPAREHWIAEMQSWWNKVRVIKLKSTNRFLPTHLIVEWFLTAGTSPDTYLRGETIHQYEKFMDLLLTTRDLRGSIQQCIK